MQERKLGKSNLEVSALGFDADEPGEDAASHMLALHPTVQRLRPPVHDWNDVLASR